MQYPQFYLHLKLFQKGEGGHTPICFKKWFHTRPVSGFILLQANKNSRVGFVFFFLPNNKELHSMLGPELG